MEASLLLRFDGISPFLVASVERSISSHTRDAKQECVYRARERRNIFFLSKTQKEVTMSEEEFRKQQIDLLSSIKNSIGCVQTLLVVGVIVFVVLIALGGCTVLMG